MSRCRCFRASVRGGRSGGAVSYKWNFPRHPRDSVCGFKHWKSKRSRKGRRSGKRGKDAKSDESVNDCEWMRCSKCQRASNSRVRLELDWEEEHQEEEAVGERVWAQQQLQRLQSPLPTHPARQGREPGNRSAAVVSISRMEARIAVAGRRAKHTGTACVPGRSIRERTRVLGITASRVPVLTFGRGEWSDRDLWVTARTGLFVE